jgi:hypothetical protein
VARCSTETVRVSTTNRRVARDQIKNVAAALDLEVEAIEERRHLLTTAIDVTLRGDPSAIEGFRESMCTDGMPAGTDPLPAAALNSVTSAVITLHNAMRRWRRSKGKQPPRGESPRA